MLTGGGLAFALGLGAATLTNSSTGCIIPDQCILIVTPGKDWCMHLIGAQMWPIGSPEQAVPVMDSDGSEPRGCACFNAAEQKILEQGVPADQFEALGAEIEVMARHACHTLVPEGYDHDCYFTGPDAPQPHIPFADATGACVGDCIYTDDCGDPTPHECECLVGPCGGSGGTGGDLGETGEAPDDTGEIGPGGLDAGSSIACVDQHCNIDADFAQMLWDDRSLLLGERTRLVHDAAAHRFVFDAVEPGSVAGELGFQTGDVLESVNGVTVDGLDAALEIYAVSGRASALRVRVLRRSRWHDFTFSFVL